MNENEQNGISVGRVLTCGLIFAAVIVAVVFTFLWILYHG